jgi:hypothetical protein
MILNIHEHVRVFIKVKIIFIKLKNNNFDARRKHNKSLDVSDIEGLQSLLIYRLELGS